jgi:acetyl-CoA carboxylase carboxyl transferase subunit beta
MEENRQPTPPAAKPCPKCGAETSADQLRQNLSVCPGCGYHYRLEPQERIAYIADGGVFTEFSADLASINPIALEEYEAKLADAQAKTSMKDAVITGTCTIDGNQCILALMSFNFMGGSMGSVVGEKVCRAMLMGARERLPVIIYATSGGARMQEGIFSLMQMAKTASAASELDRAGVPLFIVLCDPTTGGVTASFAMLGDVIIAEPGALIGFAGPRVIEGTIRESLPEGFQRAEFQLEHGFIDLISPRSEQKALLSRLIRLHTQGKTEEKGN